MIEVLIFCAGAVLLFAPIPILETIDKHQRRKERIEADIADYLQQIVEQEENKERGDEIIRTANEFYYESLAEEQTNGQIRVC